MEKDEDVETDEDVEKDKDVENDENEEDDEELIEDVEEEVCPPPGPAKRKSRIAGMEDPMKRVRRVS